MSVSSLPLLPPLQDVCPVYWCARSLVDPATTDAAAAKCVDSWLAERYGARLLAAAMACTDTHGGALRVHQRFVKTALTHAKWPLQDADWAAVAAWDGLTAHDWYAVLTSIYDVTRLETILMRLRVDVMAALGRAWTAHCDGEHWRHLQAGWIADYIATGRHADAKVIDVVRRVWAARRLPPLAQPPTELWGTHCVRALALIDAGVLAPPPFSVFVLAADAYAPLRYNGRYTHNDDKRAAGAWWRMRALIPVDATQPKRARAAWRVCVRRLAWHGVPPGDAWWGTAMDAVARAAGVAVWETVVVRYLRNRPRCIAAAYRSVGDEPDDDAPLNARADSGWRAFTWNRFPVDAKAHEALPSDAARWWAACEAINARDDATARELSWLKRGALVRLRAALRDDPS